MADGRISVFGCDAEGRDLFERYAAHINAEIRLFEAPLEIGTAREILLESAISVNHKSPVDARLIRIFAEQKGYIPLLAQHRARPHRPRSGFRSGDLRRKYSVFAGRRGRVCGHAGAHGAEERGLHPAPRGSLRFPAGGAAGAGTTGPDGWGGRDGADRKSGHRAAHRLWLRDPCAQSASDRRRGACGPGRAFGTERPCDAALAADRRNAPPF